MYGQEGFGRWREPLARLCGQGFWLRGWPVPGWCGWLTISCPEKKDFFASWRVTIMEGGRSLCYSALYGFAAQAAVLLWLYPKAYRAVHDQRVLWINGIYSAIMLFILLWNGILRIFFTSVRLRLKYRILMLLAMWIPGLNLGGSALCHENCTRGI